jgi:DNA modification methylase
VRLNVLSIPKAAIMKHPNFQSSISERNDEVICQFTRTYSSKQKPIEINFREILRTEIKNTDRYTHLIHSYPAKLLVHIPFFFLNNSYLSNPKDTVLDPFNGTGTVLLESILAGRNALGADANPLARLIAEVKVTQFSTRELTAYLHDVLSIASEQRKVEMPEVVNCDYWFSPNTQAQLAAILSTIKQIKNEQVKNFMLVSLSNCVKKVSYADHRISVPVKLNPERYNYHSEERKNIQLKLEGLKTVNVFEKFAAVANDNIRRFRDLEALNVSHVQAKIISEDARKLSNSLTGKKRPLKSESVQLIITSPPYASAQKYIRATSLNLGWLELAKPLELSKLNEKNIGRESFKVAELDITSTGIKSADKLIEKVATVNKNRAFIVCKYLLEMQEALDEMIRVLKPNGYLVLVIGNNTVCKQEFMTESYFTEYLQNQGLVLQFKLLDDIKSRGLMTKRNKTADIISREWILVFKK